MYGAGCRLRAGSRDSARRARGPDSTRKMDWLRRCHARAATIATACSGAMLLAQAGLLDGNDATTHWAYCDVMRAAIRAIRVHPRRALVVTGEGQRLVMAGGGTTWLDLAIYLIARFVSLEVAMQTARINLIDWHDIGQQPFARLARSRQVGRRGHRALPDVDRRSTMTSRRRWQRWCVCRARRALVQATLRAGHRHVAAGIRAHAAAGRSEADARSRTMLRSKRSPTRSATRTPASSAGSSGARCP